MVTCRLIALSVLAAATVLADGALAQGTFPAPLPDAVATCQTGYALLRGDAIEKGRLIREAHDSHATAEESCKLIGSYSAAEVRMIKYVEANASQCGISAQVADQLKAGHKNTEGLLQKVCGIAEQIRTRGSPGQISDFGDPAFRARSPRGPVGDFPDAHGRF
jgi:hypothetical protein